jgi:sugar/nucleoside kinase (ribokinase family)
MHPTEAILSTGASRVSDYDLLVIGEINADLIVTGPDPVPEFGQVEKLVDAGTLTMGSSSVITACGAARLGLRTAFVGIVGRDDLGRFMLDAMASRGIDVSHCLHHPTLQTGISVLLTPLGASDRRAILTAPGALGALHSDRIDPALLARARHVHCGGYFLQPGLHEGLPALFAAARAGGATCSLDPNWDPQDRWESHLSQLLAYCDLFLPNDAEARRIAGTADVDSALRTVAPAVCAVAVKRGKDGASLRWGQRILHGSAPPVHVIDTTGAGDSFDAGFLYGFLQRWSPEETLALALACGSLSTLGVGGTTAQPDLDSARALAATVSVHPESA